MTSEHPKISAKQAIRILYNGGMVEREEGNVQLNKGDLWGVTVSEQIRISNVTFDHEVSIRKCNLEAISFKNCVFNSGLTIQRTNIDWMLDIEKCTIKDSFSVGFDKDDYYSIGQIRLYDSILNNDTVISKIKIKNDVSIFFLSANDFFSISKCQCAGELSIWDIKTATELILQQSSIDNLSLSSIPEKAIVKITSSRLRRLNFDGLTNLGYLQLNSLNFEIDNPEILINNSSLGKCDIVNCDFSTARFTLYSSKITDTFYTNSVFPGEIYVPNEFKANKDEHSIRRDGYNQLKTIAQKQNDRRLFLHYQSEELKSFHKTLHWFWNFRTWFQLGAMRISNNYGVSWGLGVLFVIITNFVFVSTAYSDRPRDFTCAGLGIYFSAYLSSLFSLINVPIYFQGTWEVNWFYASRLFIAFGIYQTIAAFRKFGKSE